MADDLPPGFSVVKQPAQDDLPPGFSVVPKNDDTWQNNPVLDTIASFASGVPEGAVETAMLPVTATRGVEQFADWLVQNFENPVREFMGKEPWQKEDFDAFEANRQGRLIDKVYEGQDAVRKVMNDILYEPRTTSGEFGNTVGQFVAPGGWATRAERAVAAAPSVVQRVGNIAQKFVGDVAAPAVASEAAGQLTEGSDYEGLARLFGALVGNVTTAAGRSYNAAESIVRRAAPEMTPEQSAEVMALLNNRFGIDLSTPEAYGQVTDSRTGLQDLMRFIESTPEGRNATAPFFANRTGQIDNAVGDFLDRIAPQDANPSTLGARASGVAGEVVDQTRRDINADTRPLYDAAGPQSVGGHASAAILADPRFQAGLERLRNNAEIGPEYAHLPDDSVAVIDAVTKDMLARGEAMATRANPLYGPEQGARNTQSAVNARNAASRSSPEYAQALATQEARRADELAPLENGPVGRVANAGSTQTAGEALLPANPLAGAGPETTDAVTRMSAQDPATTAALVRQNLGDRYQKAGTETQTGSREWVGGKFHKDVAGNEARQEVLDAVLAALPQPGPTRDAAELLEVLQASGRRDAVGSPTFGNTSIASDIALMPNLAANTANAVSTGGLGLFKRLGDAATQWGARRAHTELAEILTGPDRLYLTQRAIERGAPVNFADAFLNTLRQSGSAVNGL